MAIAMLFYFQPQIQKNLKALYIIQPTMFVRSIMKLFKPFISNKFWKKLKYVDNVKEIYQYMSPQQLKLSITKAGAKDSKLKMFGLSLEECMKLPLNENHIIPVIVVRAIRYLSEHGPVTEGIFRLSGRVARIEEIRAAYDRGEAVDFSDEPEPNVIASLLKAYIRELPDPLMCFDLYEEWVQAADPTNVGETKARIKVLITKLPTTNLFILRNLMGLLTQIAEAKEVTKMPAHNLAICWAPNILKSRDEMPTMALQDAGTVNWVVTLLIEHHDEFFSGIVVDDAVK